MPSGVEALMGSRLQSNCTTHDAKVDTLMPLGFFHTFQGRCERIHIASVPVQFSRELP